MFKSFNAYYLHQRFFPGLTSLLINPFYFIRKDLLREIRPLAKELNGKLLDFGCGSKPYRSLFSHVDEYIGIDVENEGHDHQTEDVDVFYDGKTIPFGDNLFDSVFASEVLEHVPDINESLSELWRVMKPGGKILITVPLVWQEHELPYDFRRFTLTGIEKILSDNRFELIVGKKSGTFTEVVVQLGMMYLHTLFYTKNKYLNLLINSMLLFPFCLAGFILSFLLPKRKNLYFNSVVMAKKTSNA